MTIGIDSGLRVLVPRWTGSRMSRALGIFPVSRSPWREFSGGEGFLEEKIEGWNSNRSLTAATEIVANALMISRFSNSVALDAARYMVLNREKLSFEALKLARFFLLASSGEMHESQGNYLDIDFDAPAAVACARSLIQANPRNALAWSDLSYSYALLGMREKSVRAAHVAYQLGGGSPYISISSSRAMLHYGDGEASISMLERSPSFKGNPLLVSADVSIRMMFGMRQKHVDLLVRSSKRDIGKVHGVNHAAMTLATLEAMSGKRKLANSLAERSLIIPDENCLAQAVWLNDKKGVKAFNNSHAPYDFEAEARRRYLSGNFEDAYNSCIQWQVFQPFSRHPATFGSYIASVILQDYASAEKISEKGFLLSSNDHMVLNNYAVSLALNGKIDRAIEVFLMIKKDDLDKSEYATYCSSFGLLYFCMGVPEEGRRWYQRSSQVLDAMGEPKLQAISLAFWAEQEAKFDVSASKILLDKSRRLTKKTGFKDLYQRLGINN